jgi:hypothetical protein
MPEQQACTAELGPSYTLTFSQGATTLVRFRAERYGCRPITKVDTEQSRQTTTGFWDQLDRAIAAGLPVAQVQRAAIKHQVSPDQPPQTAQLASTQAAQHLYQAIIALPETKQFPITDGDNFDYEIVFHTADQTIPALISERRRLVTLQGDFHSRTGTYVFNDDFQQLLHSTLASTTFAPATPDAATLTITTTQTSSHANITSAAQIQQLYRKILSLPTTQPQPNCPSGDDKVSGKAKWYQLTFTQWDLPIMHADVYMGSCQSITIGWTETIITGRVLKGDQAFWDLLHTIAG